MHNRSAGEIQRPGIVFCIGRTILQKPAAPHPVRQGAIDEGSPEHHEDDHRAEFHPLREGAADQRRRDDEEHALKEHVRQPRKHGFPIVVQVHGNLGFAVEVVGFDPVHEQIVGVAHPGVRFIPEGE